MDLLNNSEESSSEGFVGKIEQLKNSITKMISTSEEKKSGNMEKVESIKGKIIKIKESVANILSVKDQFETTSGLLKEANSKVAEGEAALSAKQAELRDLEADHNKQIAELQSQLGEKDKEGDLVSGEYEKQIANQKNEHETLINEKQGEIDKLNEEMKSNIAEVSSITEQVEEGMQSIGSNGEDLSTALTDLESEVDGLQSSMSKTEKAIDNDNKVQAETVPMAPVETTENASDDETSVTSGQTTVEDTSSVASTEPVETEREQLIKKIKHEYLDAKKTAAAQGNLDPEGKLKLDAVEKLRSWDTNNRDRPELGSKFGSKDTLPGDKTYISTAHLGLTEGRYRGGGSKKRKQTRKKRKAKKTQKRNKKGSRK